MPYESGMDPIGDARQRFDVKFYLVAILFLVFDVELLFLYPWATVAYAGRRRCRCESAVRSSGTMLVFLATLGRGLRLRLAERGLQMAVKLPENVVLTKLDQLGQLGAGQQPLADAVRHGLLRHRADGHRRQPRTTSPASAPRRCGSRRGSAI